jgi:hypothetical protein
MPAYPDKSDAAVNAIMNYLHATIVKHLRAGTMTEDQLDTLVQISKDAAKKGPDTPIFQHNN